MTTTAPATAGCPSGYQLGIYNICYRYTAATASCPAGFDPPTQGICFKRTSAVPPCPTGYTHSGNQCTRTTAASASCPAGFDPPTQGICFKRTSAVPPCPTGYTHSGNQCTRTTAASASCPAGFDPPTQGICFKRTSAVPPCPTGYTHSGNQCTRTTAASASCPVGFDPPTQGICFKRTSAVPPCPTGYTHSGNQCTRTTAASASCPVGFDPPTQGICFKRTSAVPPCPAGYTHADDECTLDAAATASCPADYDPPTQGICFKRTAAVPPCPAGYTHADDECTLDAAATASCPADYDPPTQGICYKRTPAEHTCTTGVPRDGDCVTIEAAAVTHTCPEGEPDENNQCTTTEAAAFTCDGEPSADPACAHDHPPVIEDLAPSGTSTAGTAYTDDFTVTPATATVLVSGTGCGLSGTAGDYTLTATSDHTTDTTVRITCAVAATTTTSVTATAAIDFGPRPTAHTASPATPQGLRCSAATATTATWTWDAADRAHSYWYRYSSGDEWTEAGGRSHTRTGIVPSSSVGGWDNRQYIDVMARNNIGDSNPSYSSCLTLPPNWLTAECSATGQITAEWSKPLGLENQTGVRYTATATARLPHGYGGITLPPYTGTATAHTFAGTPGTSYTIRVQTQPITGKPTYSDTATVECELPACEQDGALSGRAGVTNHRHGRGDCHIHESAVPSCSVSEDRAYTVHTDTVIGGEPTHRDGVVLACHPGRDQGVISPQPLSVECGTDGKIRAGWQLAGADRFEVEGDLQYEGTSHNKSWDATPLASYTIRVRALWDRFGQDPVEGPWTVRKTATCPRFIPQSVNVVCDDWRAYADLGDSGTEVVTMTWESVTGATKYRISGDFSYEGPPLDSYTWQGMEGESYTLRVAAYSNGGWSAPSDDTTAQCYRNILRGTPSWNSPNSATTCLLTCHTLDPDPPAMVSRNCNQVSQTTPSTQTTRECTVTWNETIELEMNSSWDDLPIVSQTGDTIVATLGAFVATLLLGNPWVQVIVNAAYSFLGSNIALLVYRDLSGQGWVQMNGQECINVDGWAPAEAELEESLVDSTGMHTTNTTHIIKHCLKGDSDQSE